MRQLRKILSAMEIAKNIGRKMETPKIVVGKTEIKTIIAYGNCEKYRRQKEITKNIIVRTEIRTAIGNGNREK